MKPQRSHCQDCGNPTGRTYARWCDGCRWTHRGRRQKYAWTPEKDAYLRTHWSSNVPRRGQTIGAIWGWPAWVVRRRAATLGLSRPTWKGERRPWLAEEIAFLEQHAGKRHPNWLRLRLGRSLTSVVVKLKRLRLSRLPDGYSLEDVALAFGVERSTVNRWLRLGWLTPRFHREHGQPHRFTDGELLRFIREHRSAVDLGKVDPVWFLDLVLDGASVDKAA